MSEWAEGSRQTIVHTHASASRGGLQEKTAQRRKWLPQAQGLDNRLTKYVVSHFPLDKHQQRGCNGAKIVVS